MTFGKKKVFTVLAAGVLAGAAMLAAQAEQIPMDKIEPAIKYRQNVMKAMGGLTGTAVGQLRDGFTQGPELEAVAAALQALAADIPALFPEGTDFGETEAKPEVWSQREAFEQAAEESKRSIDAFAAAVQQGDRKAMLTAFKKMGDACKACHEDFREKRGR